MSLKRKYGDHNGWARVMKRKYAQSMIRSNDFNGYVTLLHVVQVSEPLVVKYGQEEVCIIDGGYMWLHQFPLEEKHAVTTMFNENGDIVQWYIDICHDIGVECGIPWLDDLFLDIVALPSGETFLLDEDELEEAYKSGVITKSLYDLAWEEANRIVKLLAQADFTLIKLANEHKEFLENHLR